MRNARKKSIGNGRAVNLHTQSLKISTGVLKMSLVDLKDSGLWVVLEQDGQGLRISLPQALALCRKIDNWFPVERMAWNEIETEPGNASPAQ